MDLFRKFFPEKPIPKPNFEGISAMPPEPVKEKSKLFVVPNEWYEDGTSKTEAWPDVWGGRHITGLTHVTQIDSRPRNSDEPVDSNPATRPDFVPPNAPTSNVPLEPTLAMSNPSEAVESPKIDKEYVESLFSNPDDIQTTADLLERLEKIKGYSFGQKMKKDDPTQMVELMGVTVWEEFKKIVLPLEEKDESVKIRNKALLKGLIGFTDSSYSTANLDLIGKYLQLHSISKDFRIREIAKRLLADQLLVR